MELAEALSVLQDTMAMIDRRTRRSRPGFIEFLIKQSQLIRLRMDGNPNHKRPHIHIDYGKDYHVASYAIDTGERLAGGLENKYDKAVRAWISTHRCKLSEAWEITQAGRKPDRIIAELKGSTFAS